MPVLYFGSFFASMIREVQKKRGDNAIYWKGYTIYGDEPIYNISYYSPQTNMSHLKATTYLTQTNMSLFNQPERFFHTKKSSIPYARAERSVKHHWVKRSLWVRTALRVVVERPGGCRQDLFFWDDHGNKWKIVQACSLESFGPCLHRFRWSCFRARPHGKRFWF